MKLQLGPMFGVKTQLPFSVFRCVWVIAGSDVQAPVRKACCKATVHTFG